ncbi:MAG: hypothetical protein RBT76_15560 [candidate division Zixibacteria bacterium]|jgi:hypothetical protein|nr:hypothetical protein [candidate division Zixibacteria bacterium]
MENQPQAAPHGSKSAMWIIILVVILILAGGAYYFLSQDNDTNTNNTNNANAGVNSAGNVNGNTNAVANANAISNVNQTANTNAASNSDGNANTASTSDWITYTNDELGMTFRYPAEYGDVVLSISAGTSGSKFSGNFSNRDTLRFGGMTSDYSFPSEGGLLHTQGFQLENEKYYFLAYTADKPNQRIEIVPLKVITTTAGNTGLLVNVKDLFPTIVGNPIGALFKLSNQEYPGIAFQNSDASVVSQADFEALLSTFSSL